MKLKLELFKNDFTYRLPGASASDTGLKHYQPKRPIKSDEIEIDFILTYVFLPQFWFSMYFPVNISEPEALGELFNSLEQQEARELIKVSMFVYTHEHQGAAEWVVYGNGKRWFNQDKNVYIPLPKWGLRYPKRMIRKRMLGKKSK